MMKKRVLAMSVLVVSLLGTAAAGTTAFAETPAYEQTESVFCNSFLNAYRDQVMPDRDEYPVLQEYYPELLEQPLVPGQPVY